jgi:hypothetical protein
MMPNEQVAVIQRSRLESDQDFIVSRDRDLNLLEL